MADAGYCTDDSVFAIKEVKLGLAADVGTLQRMPKVMGSESLLRELAYTGRDFTAAEAKEIPFGIGVKGPTVGAHTKIYSVLFRVPWISSHIIEGWWWSKTTQYYEVVMFLWLWSWLEVPKIKIHCLSA